MRPRVCAVEAASGTPSKVTAVTVRRSRIFAKFAATKIGAGDGRPLLPSADDGSAAALKQPAYASVRSQWAKSVGALDRSLLLDFHNCYNFTTL